MAKVVKNENKERKLICIDDTNFIYQTNFSGDPERDRFGNDARKANIIIPDHMQARELIDAGFNVRFTKPREDDDEETFVPTYFVSVKANYDTNWPPRIYLVSGDSEPLLLDEDTVGEIDRCYVKNVNVVLNPYLNPVTNRASLYIRTMYVEHDVEDDPYAKRYSRGE